MAFAGTIQKYAKCHEKARKLIYQEKYFVKNSYSRNIK